MSEVLLNSSNVSIYHEISECVLQFSDGKQTVISSNDTGSLLLVKVISGKSGKMYFVNSVLKNHKSSESIAELASRCGYDSTKTFTRHFKKYFNTTPKQWLLSIRKKEVFHLLVYTDFTLNKIASMLGFSNLSHMSTFCVKSIGKTPSEIRKSRSDLFRHQTKYRPHLTY